MTFTQNPLTSSATIRDDFDRIALLSQNCWNHSTHYYPFLLNAIPRCQQALEIGCGTGDFSRLLAQRADHVWALDLSPQMIRLAREHSPAFSNIDFQVADFLEYALPAETCDCVVTIATLHHLPLIESLAKVRQGLKPGGILVVLDLFAPGGLADLLTSVVAAPASFILSALHNRRVHQSAAERQAWDAHGQHDHYLTLAHIRSVCAQMLPGAQVRQHLFWRYSLIWKKPVA